MAQSSKEGSCNSRQNYNEMEANKNVGCLYSNFTEQKTEDLLTVNVTGVVYSREVQCFHLP